MYARLPTSEPSPNSAYNEKGGDRRNEKQWGPSRKSRKRMVVDAAAPPKHVHYNDWREMLALTTNSAKATNTHISSPEEVYMSTGGAATNNLSALPSISGTMHTKVRASSSASLRNNSWIEQVFKKRECAKFIPSNKYPNKCGCGRLKHLHSANALTASRSSAPNTYGSAPSLDKRLQRSDEEPDHEMTAADSEAGPIGRRTTRSLGEKWTIRKHTIVTATDSYGTIEFQGGPHPYKAQYLRLNVETDPADIMNLFENIWQMPPPKLIITVHGGITNFDLQPKLARVFRKGLLKAARTTGAWIITSGINAGVVHHVAAALEGCATARSKIVSIGITPWGLIKKREDLIGQDIVVPYHPHSFSPRGRFAVLNNRHSYFLLVDNGTVGRYGADVILRKRLETYIAQKQKIGGGTRSVPVVCVVLEGGTCTIRAVLDYVTNTPRVPVVVCDGSGRAADLLAFAHQYIQEDGKLPDGIRPQLLRLVENVFGYDKQNAEKLLLELTMCAQQKHLMTVFRLGETQKQDVDHAILTALLKGQNLSAPDQLALALAWNRVDIARSDIFVLGQDWPKAALNNAMMEALINDRVDFVRLLLENGVSMNKFLTVSRLEELYNTDRGPPNTLYYIVRDVVKIRPGYRYRIPHIGLAIEKLMGNGFRSSYTSEAFRAKYSSFRNKIKLTRKKERQQLSRSSATSENFTGVPPIALTSDPALADTVMAALSGSRALSNHILWRSAFRRDNPVSGFNSMMPPAFNEVEDTIVDIEDDSAQLTFEERVDDFRYPFSELFLWAVLTKRQEMALCMWQHGEEAMAKALVACRLYKSLAQEAAEDYLEVEICEELRQYAEEFRLLSLELLDHCYQHDDAQTLQLLTYELSNWGNETCLSLAVMVNNKQFLAHPCCQILLADLWHGGLRMRNRSNLKVVLGLLCPLTIFLLEFKSREELMLQPQTAAEHEDDINESSSSSSSSSESDSSSDSDYTSDDSAQGDQEGEKRKMSSGSVQSLNLTGLFQSRRKRAKQQSKDASANSAAVNGHIPVQQQFSEMSPAALSPPADHLGDPSQAEPVKRKRAISIQSTHSHQFFPGVRRGASRQSSVSKSYKHEHHRRRHPDNASLSNAANGLCSHFVGAGRKHTTTSVDNEPDATAPNTLHNVFSLAAQSLPRTRPIKFRRKLYEFYVAPVTTFWAWSLSFSAFICCNTYILLVRTPPEPTALEWAIFVYMVTFGMEHLRKYIMSEPDTLLEKAKYFFNSIWNILTTIALLSYFIGFILRANPPTSSTYGRVILASNSVMWSVKLLDFMSVHPRMGPYITMAGKMIQNMTYVVILLCVTLLAFGLARQSITYPHEDWHWMLLRNIFYKPYFMLYGEVYADEIDTCGDEAWDRHMEDGIPISSVYNGSFGSPCVPGHWVPPLLMTIFLLIANILLISMLLAIFNNIFDKTDKISKEIWLFQRYRQVMEYESTPFLPPPLTPLYHLWMAYKYFRVNRGCRPKNNSKSRTNLFDFTLKLFLNDDQVEKLHDFEEDCMEDLAREKEFKRNTSNEERIHRTAERTEQVLVRLNDLATKGSVLKGTVRELDNRLEVIESSQAEILDCLRQIMSAMPMLMGKMPQTSRIRSPSTPPAVTIDEESEEGRSHPQVFDTVSTTVTSEVVKPNASASTSTPPPVSGTEEFIEPGRLVKRRMRTTTAPGGDSVIPNSPLAKGRISHFGSLLSLDPSLLNQVGNNSSNSLSRRSNCGSVRRPRRHEEYTSITDAISIADVLPQVVIIDDKSRSCSEQSIMCYHAIENDEEDEVVDEDEGHEVMPYCGSDTPTTTLQRAKRSFVRRQNSMLKEYEEELTERMRDAIRRQSTEEGALDSLATHMANDEELSDEADVGSLTEPELKDLADDEDDMNSSKEYIEFCISKHPESESTSSLRSSVSRRASLQIEQRTQMRETPRSACCSLTVVAPTSTSDTNQQMTHFDAGGRSKGNKDDETVTRV
uniref:Transient receptor potential channel n=1 Tax=Parascaris univalens TaxID=6257 RepID=A0A915BSL5_PARUN